MNAMRYWLKTAGLHSVGEFLMKRAIKPAELTRRLGWPSTLLMDPELWMERDQCLLLISEMARVTGDSYAGLHIGEQIELSRYGAWGRDVLACASLADALTRASKNVSLVATGTCLKVSQRGKEVRLAVRFAGRVGADPSHHDQAHLAILRKFVDLAAEPVPVAIHAPERMLGADGGLELQRILRAEALQRGPEPALTFPREALELPLWPAANARAATISSCRRLPAETGQALVRCLNDADRGSLNMPAAAASLSMGVRTLQRHLSRWGVCFETIADEYRCEQALQLLTSSALPITDIAYDLGYSDCAHFTRAVRRWTNCTPSEIRKKGPGGIGSNGAWDLPTRAAERGALRREQRSALLLGNPGAGRIARRTATKLVTRTARRGVSAQR